MNAMNNGTARQRGTRVIGPLHETLLPRSRPKMRAKIAQTNTKAPKKSTRRSLIFQSDFSVFDLGSLSTNPTLINAKMHSGT